MSFTAEKKERIVLYLAEKISQGDSSAVRKTAEAFEITPATVYKYLDGLTENGVVKKIKRGQYALVRKTVSFQLERSAGQLTSEQAIFENTVQPELRKLPKNAAEIWDYIFGEMVNNIIDHSEAEHVTILLQSDYLNTGLLLLDDGVGIFEKIKNHFGFSSLEDAVGELFKGKLTTDAEHHSGEGIFFSSRIADRFLIASSGKVFTHDSIDADELQSVFSVQMPNRGTFVFAALSNRTKKKASDVFDAFADIDGGFTKTGIPLCRFFESSPVSRSQAKRLCSRLNSFSEVELDFSEVEWMGQGFAHQLFVVFARENPDVRLLPLHMNEAVTKMYRHVLKTKS